MYLTGIISILYLNWGLVEEGREDPYTTISVPSSPRQRNEKLYFFVPGNA